MCESELPACKQEEQPLQAAAMAGEANHGHVFTMEVLMHRSSVHPTLPPSRSTQQHTAGGQGLSSSNLCTLGGRKMSPAPFPQLGNALL